MKSQNNESTQDKSGSKGQISLTSVQFFNALNKYIPSLVLQNWIDRNKIEEEETKAALRAQKSSHKYKEQVDKEDSISTTPKVPAKPKQQLPYIQDMETVVLFADISGFTNISEACAKLGIRGNEELAFCINRYMEGMVKNLAKFGGDIIKFVGDAMIVMWPRKKLSDNEEEDSNVDDEKVNVIRKAIQCAQDIQKELNNKKILANVTNLSVKIGIAYGKCALLYVGGVFDRAEFFTVGSALTYALKSEEHATGGGQIIVSETAFKHVKNQFYEAEEIISEDNKKFYRVTKTIIGVRGRADAVLLKSHIKYDSMAQIQKSLRSCVPAAIMPYLEIGYEQFGSETRPLTVMFASLGVDLSSASSIEGMNKIQQIVTTVQQQVYRLEGSLNKLVMDDKGSTLICIWGLCPMAHKDDAQRAILTAINMRRELLKIEKTWCNVGIATGDVFSGVVGTSGSRKEFSCLGDTVNLAARIMFYPLKYGKKGQINCCLRTKNEAMNSINFKYGGHCEFKGKSISIPIYEPQDPREELTSKDINTLNPLNQLKLHFNPLIVQREINHRKPSEPFIGKNQFTTEVYDKVKGYFFGQEFSGSPDKKVPLCIAITGPLGSGKTHLTRTIVEKLIKDQNFMKQNNYSQSKTKVYQSFDTSIQNKSSQLLHIFASSNSCDQRMKFLGAWRPILKAMLAQRAKQMDTSKDEVLRSIMKQEQYQNKADVIMEIFGQILGDDSVLTDEEEKMRVYGNLNIKKSNQVKSVTITSPIWFLLRQKFDQEVTSQLMQIVLTFIMQFTGNYDISRQNNQMQSEDSSINTDSEGDETNNKSKGKSSNKTSKQTQKSKIIQPTNKSHCFFIFDNASVMEDESYQLILKVFDTCTNVGFMLIVDQDQKGNPIFPELDIIKQKKTRMTKIAQKFIDTNFIFDMPPISNKALHKLLVDLAPKYQASFQEEIKGMTDIIYPDKTIKTVEKSQEWHQLLTQKYNLEKVFDDVDDQVIEVVMQKCNSNVLFCLHFFFHLMTNDYLDLADKNGKVIVVQKPSLVKIRKLQNFTKIPVPSFAIKMRLKNLDSFLKEGKDPKYKGSLRKQETHVKGLMILKTAAIIGEEFGTQALKKILPLRHENHNSIYSILKELEVAELIEILDETDMKNIHCRFNQAFLRESIYQVMLYRDQKQVLHQQLADYIQSLPSSIMSQEQIDVEIDKLRDHILIGEDVQTEEELPFKQKYGIIVKQMQNKLITNNQNIILFKSPVYKQGQAANKKIAKRVLILTSRELMWFHDDKEYAQSKQPLGLIKVENIFNVYETLMQSSTYDFEIAVTQYFRKGILDKNIRHIKFGCKDENDRNNWISRIEFLKAKIVYDQYVNKFFNIQFPLKKEEDLAIDDSEQKKDDSIQQLHQFGKNFKQIARIDHSSVFSIMKQTQVQTIQGLNSSHKKNSSVRQSILQTQSLLNNVGIDYQENDNETGQQVQNLAIKLSQLYNASLVGVFNHINSNANKHQSQGISKKVGKLPDYYQPEWIQEGQKDQNQMISERLSDRFSDSKKLKLMKNTSERQLNRDKIQEQQFNQKRSSHRVQNLDQVFQEIQEQSEGSGSSSIHEKREHK